MSIIDWIRICILWIVSLSVILGLSLAYAGHDCGSVGGGQGHGHHGNGLGLGHGGGDDGDTDGSTGTGGNVGAGVQADADGRNAVSPECCFSEWKANGYSCDKPTFDKDKAEKAFKKSMSK
jgi:hypothetical protein